MYMIHSLNIKFHGREQELQDLRTLLVKRPRPVNVVGPPNCGKSELLRVVADRLRQERPVLYLSLKRPLGSAYILTARETYNFVSRRVKTVYTSTYQVYSTEFVSAVTDDWQRALITAEEWFAEQVRHSGKRGVVILDGEKPSSALAMREENINMAVVSRAPIRGMVSYWVAGLDKKSFENLYSELAARFRVRFTGDVDQLYAYTDGCPGRAIDVALAYGGDVAAWLSEAMEEVGTAMLQIAAEVGIAPAELRRYLDVVDGKDPHAVDRADILGALMERGITYLRNGRVAVDPVVRAR